MIRLLFLVLLSISSILNSYGQSHMIIRGRVLDTVGHEPIASATVSIYKKENGKILKYGFTNNRGGFNLAEVPLADSVFQLRISYIGYQNIEMNISRALNQTDINIGDIHMKSVTTLLDEVHVKLPPIMMKRDTLIINPEAFDLKPNAVVEDLLTKVPGIVIWGDGAITVNGKKVDKVLVEGQSFFGSNPSIATRNLPSDAIDKVKVYDSPKNSLVSSDNSLDREETLEMDILLKNKKKRGFFGKISLGEGTQKHNERTFLINSFDPKNQISVFAGSNNTNKIVNNASDFLAANVYKAGGEDLKSNTPSFDQRGLNDFFIVGTKFERKWNDSLRTNLQLLHNDRKSKELTDVHEIRLLADGNEQEIVENRQDHRKDIRQSYLGTALYAVKNWELRINSNIQQGKKTQDQLYTRQVTDQTGQNLSDLQKDIHNREQNRKGKLGFNLRQLEQMGPVKFDMSYEFETENRKKEQQENILFTNDDPLDRLKKNKLGNSRHEMKTLIGGLDRLVGKAVGVSNIGVGLDFNSALVALHQNEDQRDFFFDNTTHEYTIKNQAISYSDRLREIMWAPNLSINKAIQKQKGKGVNKWNFMTAMGLEIFSRKNASDHELRVLDQKMLYMLPSATVKYNQTRQLSNKSVSIGYQSLIKQPGVRELISLVDTTQKDFNYIGNRDLRPEEQYQFSFKYTDMHFSKNRNQTLNISYSLRKNQHVNSSTYLPDGERVSQTVNTDGLPSFQADYYYRRGRTLWGKALNVSLISTLYGGKRYFFNNDVRYKNTFVRMSHSPEIQYVPFDQLKVGLLGSISTYWNSTGLSKTKTNSSSVGLDGVLSWPARTTWISRLERKHYSTKGLPTEELYIWNIDVYYRMLKKEQLEIKLSAIDILNNNKTVQNILTDNAIRQVRLNNIQQYFIISLSYYPRMF